MKLLWFHRFNANELGLGNRGSFCLVPVDARDLLPTLDESNNFKSDVNLYFNGRCIGSVNYSKPSSKTEYRLSLSILTLEIGDDDSHPISPGSVACFYKQPDGIGFDIVENDSIWTSLLDEYASRRSKNNLVVQPTIDISLLENKNDMDGELPKPFLLLAGISGTGKTRFVREQAKRSCGLNYADAPENPENLCVVAVRPDWHEPSDLLGYVSRISGEDKYIPTQFLSFLVKAWQEVFDHGGSLSDIPSTSRPFWLCLDEMNLAPVEQYFADYLSVLESRKWDENGYSSQPIIREKLALVRDALGGSAEDTIWRAFAENGGIPLPPNLIVAGTVNMDETTHGFSRKVIDRALTLDFQEFFPNDFEAFFSDEKSQALPKTFTFPTASAAVNGAALAKGLDEVSAKASRDFLAKVNGILENTPFQLAYRALNEILLSVSCNGPYDEDDEGKLKLEAVWDDFLMQKVLPRIEGDSQKLKSILDTSTQNSENEDVKAFNDVLNELSKSHGKGTILHQLYALLATDCFKEIWGSEENLKLRPDLMRETEEKVACRSRKKLEWMMKRLKANHFTDFWV